MTRRILFATAVLLATTHAGDAQALCLTCSCTVSANTLSFGSFSPLLGNVEAVGEIDISCLGLTTALDSLSIELSTGGSSAYVARQMRNGANTIAYNLYSDPARTIVWGDGTGGSSALVVQNQLSLISWTTSAPVYARAAPSPTAPPGVYTDTIVVTVEW